MKNVLIALGITALTVILLEALTPLAFIVSLFSGILFGIGTVVVLLARSRGENPETMAKEVVEAAKAVVTESKSSVEERAASEQLARTYETLLLSGKAPTVVPAVQELIMTLRPAVSRALQFAEASETTFNVVKLAKEDLFEAVRLFLDLSDTDRAAKQGEFIAQLSTLSKKIVELVSIIDAGQADAFDAQSGFINLKFN